jgi:hypothetical protein
MRAWMSLSIGVGVTIVAAAMPYLYPDLPAAVWGSALVIGVAFTVLPLIILAFERWPRAFSWLMPSRPLHSADLMSAWDAIETYILPHCRPNDPDSQALSRAVSAFKTAAFDEKISVWGREDNSPDVALVDKWFWKSADMDIIDSMRDNGGIFETFNDRYAAKPVRPRRIVECVVDKRQILKSWPQR